MRLQEVEMEKIHNFKYLKRAAALFCLETVVLTKRQETDVEVAELKMLRFSLGMTRMDRIRNKHIRGQHRSHV